MNNLQKISPLPTQWLGHSNEYVAAIGSTNDELKGRTAVSHGHLLLTDYQSAGRGRLNRAWIAPAKTSLLMSIYLQLNWPSEQAGWLTMMLGLAVVEGIQAQTGLQPALKWPNDVVIARNGIWHKTCGMLVEVEFGANGRLQSAILGCGLNVNILDEQLPIGNTPATSLMLQTGQTIPRVSLLHQILHKLEAYYTLAEQGQSPKAAWEAMLVTLGQPVTATYGDGRMVEGLATAVDEWGHLIVNADTGEQHVVRSADVTLRSLNNT